MKPTLFPGRVSLTLLALLCLSFAPAARPAEIELTLQTRDPATGQIMVQTEKVDPAHVGVIAVDVWNYHWCKTATMRVDAIAPRRDAAGPGSN